MEPHGPEDADDNGPLDGSWNGHHGKILDPESNVILNAGSFLSGRAWTSANALSSMQGLRTCHSVFGR